jgi:cytochrome c-type protein NapC
VIGPGPLTAFVFLLSIALVVLLLTRPSITAAREGKILAFIALFLFPLLCTAIGLSTHMERSKTTAFCLSCHVMEQYGKSLYVDDPHYIAAAHFQNHRVPSDQACYTCHTDYVLYGGVRAKLRGLHHVYVQYIGAIPHPIKLYTPFNNRECLHCHLGARSFGSNPIHMAILDSLKSNETSCLTSGCHDTVHDVDSLDRVKFWSPAP